MNLKEENIVDKVINILEDTKASIINNNDDQEEIERINKIIKYLENYNEEDNKK